MDVTTAIEHIISAKREHLKWVQRAKLLAEGLPLEHHILPSKIVQEHAGLPLMRPHEHLLMALGSTDCQFGHWLNEYAIYFDDTSTETIQRLHHALHDHYLAIFKLYFETQSTSSTRFTTHTLSAHHQAHAREHVIKLEHTCKAFVRELRRLENHIYAHRSLTPKGPMIPSHNSPLNA